MREKDIHNQEKPGEIRQMLAEAAKYLHVPIMDTELDAMTKRLLPYYGPELFAVLLAIGNDNGYVSNGISGGYMPTGVSIENKVRVALGKAPLKMLTEELIEKRERELVVSGVPVAEAAKGAKFMKQVIARKEEPVIVPMATADDLLGDFEESTENLLTELETF